MVDDEPPVRRAFGRVLRRHGFTVRTASSPEDARAALAEFPPDVVLVDYMLDRASGAELIPYLVSRKPRPGIAVVTAHLDARLATEMAAVSVVCVPKPVPSEILVSLVSRLASREDRLEAMEKSGHSYGLSAREIEAVRGLVSCSYVDEIATRMQCKRATVDTYLLRARKKVGAATNYQLLSTLLVGR